MRIAHSVDEAGNDPNSVVTVGTFDGVHLGHQAVIQEVIREARQSGDRSVVVTFDPHPRQVVGSSSVQLLATLGERLEVFGGLGVDLTLVLPFTYEFSRQQPREFYERYIVRGTGVRQVIVGHDHLFGKDRQAGINELTAMGKEFGFSAVAMNPVRLEGETVSSSNIRTLIAAGDVDKAGRHLGAHYTISGTVIQGDGRGRTLGFPTANIRPIDRMKLIPANGVYVVRATVDGEMHGAMANIGTRPTFGLGQGRVIEAHLFEFDRTIYGREIRLGFLHRLRSEQNFSSAEALMNQLQQDRIACQNYLATVQSL